MGGFGTGRSHPDPARLFFSISKLVSFKKIKQGGAEMGKFPNSPCLHFIFVLILILIFFIFAFFFIILKLIFFIKIKIL